MRRRRNAKIVGTLGSSSNDTKTIERLFNAGIDVFRLNFSHGTHDDHARTHGIIRELQNASWKMKCGRPIGILADLQGLKLRVGTFANGSEMLLTGEHFTLDRDPTPGVVHRATLPHPEIFAALTLGAQLLINDGKRSAGSRLRVVAGR